MKAIKTFLIENPLFRITFSHSEDTPAIRILMWSPGDDRHKGRITHFIPIHLIDDAPESYFSGILDGLKSQLAASTRANT